MSSARLKPERIQCYALSRAVDGGPVSSLAPMPTRNGLLLRVTTVDGVVGWGEAWCNYPPAGNLAKLGLIKGVIGPELLALDADHWHQARPQLESLFARMVIHTGEPGPFAHCLAAIDMAFADIAAQIAGLPLADFLLQNQASAAGTPSRVAVYSSTPDVTALETVVPALESQGHNCFKLKVGFDHRTDIALLERFRSIAAEKTTLCLDANQNWQVDQASEFIALAEQYAPHFIEEPLMADAPAEQWCALSRASSLSLAAGENISSEAVFRRHINEHSLQVVQPDVAKWGGVSGAIAVGNYAQRQGAVCYLHYMGTALGLAASLHCLAAIGGSGRVELDSNPNPLRTELGNIDLSPLDSSVALPTGTGIGFVPAADALKKFTVASCDLTHN